MKSRQLLTFLTSAIIAISMTGCNACTEQHNPRPDQAKFAKERATAHEAKPKLKEDGSLPEAPKPAADSSTKVAAATENAGVQKYKQFCTACHGADGMASGPAAAAMNPKPRNLTSAEWQASVDDAHIAKVIKEGGASVGLSATMAPWGAVINDDEIQQIVTYIRSLKK